MRLVIPVAQQGPLTKSIHVENLLQSSHLNFGVDIANGKLNACKSDAEIIERVWVQIRNRSEKLTNVYHEVQTWRKSKEIF